jgi:hypothetical protein
MRMPEATHPLYGDAARSIVSNPKYDNQEHRPSIDPELMIRMLVGRGQDTASLLDHCLSGLCTEEQVHNRQGAEDLTMGARSRPRDCASAAR